MKPSAATAENPARIALFMPRLSGGGAERVMLDLGREMANRGLLVDLVVARAIGPLLNEVPTAVRLIDLHSSRVIASLPPLVRYLRASRPAGLLSTMGHANIVALWAKMISGVSMRVVIRETSTPSQALANHRLRRTRLLPVLVRWFYRVATGIVAASEGMAEDLSGFAGIPRERIRVIYNPAISPELYTRAAEPVTHPWFAPGNPPVVLGVGRLTRAKDFPMLIHAFSLVRRQRPARLVILGEGEDRLALAAKAQELGVASEVDMPGFVANPFPYMRQAAVFALSSAWEGLPNALIQALALGTPVVSTDCPSGPREILKGGALGDLVPVGNAVAMSQAIADVFGGKRFQVLADDLARFQCDAVTREYLDLILGVPQGD